MSNKEFRALMDLFMCLDPWPFGINQHTIIENFLNKESNKRGYVTWIEAYHSLGEE